MATLAGIWKGNCAQEVVLMKTICLSLLIIVILTLFTGSAVAEEKVKSGTMWQNDPAEFARLIFGDDPSIRPKRGTKEAKRRSDVEKKVKGAIVEWTMTYGIDPAMLVLLENKQALLKDGTIEQILALDQLYMNGNDGIFVNVENIECWIKISGWNREMFQGIAPNAPVIVKMGIDVVESKILYGGILEVTVRPTYLEAQTSSKKCDWPVYDESITEHVNKTTAGVSVINHLPFPVKVGLRSGAKGGDFIVPQTNIALANVPIGRYDIYFHYASEPGSLYKGDPFELKGIGVKITLGKSAGNYNIQKVR